MELYYYREIANIRRIKIHQEESRLLYDSGRDLTIEFSERNGKPLLEDYEITGFQKMVLMDTVRYSIAGKVVH